MSINQYKIYNAGTYVDSWSEEISNDLQIQEIMKKLKEVASERKIALSILLCICLNLISVIT